MTRVLNYSENDFPSLKNSSNKKTIQVKKKIIFSSSGVYGDSDCICQKQEKQNTSDSFKSDQNVHDYKNKLCKVLKPNKHKETYLIPIGDVITESSEKPCTKYRKKRIKRLKDDVIISGNPLDTDNPIRIKAKINVRKIRKRTSKIKSLVYKAREERKKQDGSSKVTIQEHHIFVNSTIPKDDAKKATCFTNGYNMGYILDQENVNRQNKVECVTFSTDVIKLPNSTTTSDSVDQQYSTDQNNAGNLKREKVISQQTVRTSSTIPLYKLLIHHHNFKTYCDNCVTNELNRTAEALISQIVRFQYNKYQVNPIKAVANKRYVLGFRQVKKYIKLNKIKLMVMVPDMEEALCHVIEELKLLASTYCIPYFFAFSRRKLGFLAYKKVGVSCFGILDYSSAEENFSKTMETASLAKKYYKENCSRAKEYYKLHFDDTSKNHHIRKDISELIIEDFREKLSLKNNIDECTNSTK